MLICLKHQLKITLQISVFCKRHGHQAWLIAIQMEAELKLTLNKYTLSTQEKLRLLISVLLTFQTVHQ